MPSNEEVTAQSWFQAEALVHESDVSRERQIQMQWILEWFMTWEDLQKKEFLKDLLSKAIPSKVSVLFEAMEKLQMQDMNPSLHACQMKLFDEWFQNWSNDERNFFLTRLDEIDSDFVGKLHDAIAETCGSP